MKILYLFLTIFAFSYTLKAQQKFDSQTQSLKPIWTDTELYKFAKKYNLQDALFLSPFQIKSSYTMLRIMTSENIDLYFKEKIQSIEDEAVFKEAKIFNSHAKQVKSTSEYLALLKKYPKGAMFWEKAYNNADYSNIYSKIQTGQILILKNKETGQISLVNKKYLIEEDISSNYVLSSAVE
jgi:hypothetical protein